MGVSRSLAALGWGLLGLLGTGRAAAPDLPNPQPVPEVQVLPLPHDEASFVHAGRELTRYHFAPGQQRPFWYPMLGPEGRSLTRMGHPHDPQSHSHHNSVWISHSSVNGVNFWADRGTPPPGRIVQQQIEQFDDGPASAAMLTTNAWQGPEGKVLLSERRRAEVRPLGGAEWLLLVDLQLEAPAGQATVLGASPFGLIGVRMAKTIGVHDGGGRILNSQGQVNEAEAFRQPARWVDYSGPVTNDLRAGIALLDHPSNAGHPTPFHVRDDGWMGASLTLRGPLEIAPGKPLRLRYALWVHDGVPTQSDVERHWQQFAHSEPPPMVPQRK